MKRTLSTLLLWLCFAAQAAPAPWYWWASTSTGQQVCSQTSPGSGWTRASGPFQTSRCGR